MTAGYPEMFELSGAPFKKCKNTGRVTDKLDEEVQMFDDVHEILRILHTDKEFSETRVAVASSTTYPDWARSCMKLLSVNDIGYNLESMIHFKTIYPRNKKVHFRELRTLSGIEYNEMLFFDNESYNIMEVGELGVTCIHCPDGMTLEHFERGLHSFHQMKL